MRAQPTCLGDEKLPRNLARWSERLARVLNKNISYGSTMLNTDNDINLSIWKDTGTTPGANVAFTINHSLGRIPITIVGQDTNNGGVLYRGGTWTKTQVILKCTTATALYNVILA
jgi:hypothetical protein